MIFIRTIEEFKEKYKPDADDDFFEHIHCSMDVLSYAIENCKLNRKHWKHILSYQPLTEDFIIKYIDSIRWGHLFDNKKLEISYEFMEKFLYHFNLYAVYHHIIFNNTMYVSDIGEWILKDTNLAKIFTKLKNNYPHKYEIDKLSYELSFNK